MGTNLIQRTSVRRAGAVLLIAIVACCGGCKPKAPEIKLRDIQIVDLNLRTLDITFEFSVHNPNHVNLKLRDMEVTLHAGGQKIATGALDEDSIKLRFRKTVNATCVVSIEHSSVLPILRKIQSHDPVPYTLSGRAVFGAFMSEVPVTFKHSGKIALLEAPKWKIREIRPVPGSRPAVKLVFEITNPNAIDIPLISASGSLTVNGEELLSLNQTAPDIIPAKDSAELVISIPVNVSTFVKIARLKKIPSEKRNIEFNGNFSFGPPTSLRKLMLGNAMGK